MKVLITGAGGYLGKHMIQPFEEAGCELRLMDVVDFDTPHEKFIGDVSNLADVAQALEGVDGVVIAHMASRQAGAYDDYVLPFDANVKGTALLFSEAQKIGVMNIVLISSVAAVQEQVKNKEFLTGDLPLQPKALYGLTKALQEQIAEYHVREFGMTVASIRPAYVIDMDSMADKYGRVADCHNDQFVDPRDIGEVARLSLLMDGPRYEVFYPQSTPEAAEKYDMEHVMKTLNWKPKYDFSTTPICS